jgi:four helix bundle protein
MATTFRELRVWQNAMDLAMEVFEISKRFPAEERFSMTDQVRRASRSIATNTAEAWRKRRYKAAFVSKLSDAETEAAETQTWVELALRSNYISTDVAQRLDARCEEILGQLVTMIRDASNWCRLSEKR